MRSSARIAGKALKRAIGFMLCAIIFVTVPLSCIAYAADGDTVTVAYIDYNSFIEKGADGLYSGYGVDYLNRISQYTGWNYKYVDMDWRTAYEAVRSGAVDFYCVARQTEERQADFDFSLYPICSEEMNLYTLPDKQIYYDDYAAFNGMRIGMLEESGETDYFNAYAEENGFAYTLVEYPMNEDAVQALRSGEVDAIALVNYSVDGEFKLVGNFGVAPAYLMSRDGSLHMQEFSRAQERLYFDEPAFSRDLEVQYYGESRQASSLLLTRGEADFISAAQPLTVALSVDMAPIEYYDEETGSFKGVSVDLYRRISELTGLKFNFVRREDAPTLTAQMSSGTVQLVGALARNESVAKELHLTQSRTFSENSFMLITREPSALSADSVVAVPDGYPKFVNAAKQEGYSKFDAYPTFEECIDAVDSGKAQLTYIISMCEGYLLDHAQYAELRAFPCSGTEYGICLGAYEEYDARLISIINKCLAAIPDVQVNELIVTNTAAARPKQTLRDFTAKNGAIIINVAIVILALAIVAIVRYFRAKQRVEMNKKLHQHHDFLQHLYDTLPCGIIQYDFEPPHTILNCNAACAKIYGREDETSIVGALPGDVVEKGTEEAFNLKFAQRETMGRPIMYIWPITRQDGSRGYTECVLDIVEAEQGKVFQEVFIDVTERVQNEKLLEKRYMQELNRTCKRGEGLLYTACFDVADQILMQTDIDVEGIHSGMTVEEFVAGLQFELKDLQSKEEMDDFATRFTVERLQADYDDGRYEQSFYLCRYKDGQIQWLRSDLALRHNPATGHLMCFDYIWDVTDERITYEVARRLAFADCEGFMSVFASTGRCLEYKVEKDGKMSRTETVYGENDVIKRLAQSMSEEDAAEFIAATQLDIVDERLQTAPHYQVYATLTDEDGERRDKALVYFYTNEDNGVLAVTISDVTEVRADEVHRARMLSDALAAAEKADAAKSQFLSRVSHEMRTPLNAIIGFIELAKEADAEREANYLASSDIAAKQLLAVINDVLDMSSIESGKMKIANASFNFRHLVSSITNIYGTQCRQKGVRFETRITTPMDDWLVGDELRVNQILMNLLGNAVKFTSEGRIWLTISETAMEGEKVLVRFTIADSGCGMSGEMKERLFKPFEQESAATARKYGGSGLGLSIVKNLVGMMDGKIRVESKQGEGTVFIVDLPFLRSDVNQALIMPTEIKTLRVLAVDDEKSEREYISLVLERMGVRFTCVESGAQAIVELEKAEEENDAFNVCLVDWRMPEMNGFDTTVDIRKKYGKDVVVIVVSAYDFQQAGDVARDAGANMFLSKPIFQSALFDLFMTLTDGRIAETKDDEPQSWDFSGRRVLLAEDNTLNQIVAKGYLSKYNVVVDVAANGQVAADMFIASAPGYYDAILMDIQMPVMDGIESTRMIRESQHPQAKTIQIIAQSADAFNEDIARAISAGMNAHVAKPIKPDVLAKELYRAFSLGTQQ